MVPSPTLLSDQVRSLAELRRDNAQQRFEDVAEIQARRLFPSGS